MLPVRSRGEPAGDPKGGIRRRDVRDVRDVRDLAPPASEPHAAQAKVGVGSQYELLNINSNSTILIVIVY